MIEAFHSSKMKLPAPAGIRLVLVSLCLLIPASYTNHSKSTRIFNAYYPNWGQYRPTPYTYLPDNVTGIASRLNHILYAYADINPLDHAILFSDANDTNHVRKLMTLKESYPQVKVLISIGGDSFASDRFSDLVSSEFKRSSFVRNLKSFLSTYKFDGVDLSWKYPCSSSRILHKKTHPGRLVCDEIINEYDAGSSCPSDAQNYLSLVKELRNGLGNKTVITVTGPALPNYYKQLYLGGMSGYIDYWHVATYDYTVSATNGSTLTAPNSPLMSPPKESGVSTWNINTTGKYIIVN